MTHRVTMVFTLTLMGLIRQTTTRTTRSSTPLFLRNANSTYPVNTTHFNHHSSVSYENMVHVALRISRLILFRRGGTQRQEGGCMRCIRNYPPKEKSRSKIRYSYRIRTHIQPIYRIETCCSNKHIRDYHCVCTSLEGMPTNIFGMEKKIVSSTVSTLW